MTTIDEQFEGLFDTWLRILATNPQPGDTHSGSRADWGLQPGATRYGEWEGQDGRPHALLMTHPDWMLNQVDVLRGLEGHLDHNDVVVVAAPYELSLLGASLERAVEWTGATLISVGTSNTICPRSRLLDLVHQYQVTALVCEPQLAAELATLDEAAGRDPSRSSVTTLIFTRPAAPERLLRVATAWGAVATDIFSTPLRPATAVRCDSGQLHLFDGRFEAALRLAEPGRISPECVRGELVLTTMHVESSHNVPLPTGELVEFPPRDAQCACGSNSQVVIPLGSVADAITTPNGLVTRVDVEYCLFASSYLQGGITTEVDGDRMSVACAVRDSPRGHHRELQDLVRGVLGPSIELTFSHGDIADVNTSIRSS